MAVIGASYQIPFDFNIYSLSISRNFLVKLGAVSNLWLYTDFAFMQKKAPGFTDSYVNVTGVLVSAGNVHMYLDYAAGTDHSWLGGNYVDHFSNGNPDAKWETRFNIKKGYYFFEL